MARLFLENFESGNLANPWQVSEPANVTVVHKDDLATYDPLLLPPENGNYVLLNEDTDDSSLILLPVQHIYPYTNTRTSAYIKFKAQFSEIPTADFFYFMASDRLHVFGIDAENEYFRVSNNCSVSNQGEQDSTTIIVEPYTWYTFEMYIEIEPGSCYTDRGICELWIDGTQEIYNTNSRTGGRGNDEFTYLVFNNGYADKVVFDDIIIDSTSAFDVDLSDGRISAYRSGGAGGAANWTPYGAAQNWQCVNDVGSDVDDTYIYTNTDNITDSYTTTFSDSTSFGKLNCVQVDTRAVRMGNCVPRIMAPYFNIGGPHISPQWQAIPNTFRVLNPYMHRALWGVNPSTGSEWTGNEIVNLELTINVPG